MQGLATAVNAGARPFLMEIYEIMKGNGLAGHRKPHFYLLD